MVELILQENMQTNYQERESQIQVVTEILKDEVVLRDLILKCLHEVIKFFFGFKTFLLTFLGSKCSAFFL